MLSELLSALTSHLLRSAFLIALYTNICSAPDNLDVFQLDTSGFAAAAFLNIMVISVTFDVSQVNTSGFTDDAR